MLKKFIKSVIIWISYILLNSLRKKTTHNLPKPLIVIVWHEEGHGVLKANKNQNNYIMLNDSSNARMLVPFYKKMKWIPIFGSKKSKSVSSLKKIVNLAYSERIFITADGSSGPRRVIKPGAILAAKKSRCPIIVARFKFKGIRLNTWDKNLIPFPFSSIYCYYSKPINIDPNQSVSSALKLVSKTMYDLSKSINDPECN